MSKDQIDARGPNALNDRFRVLPTPVTPEAVAALPLLENLEKRHNGYEIDDKQYMVELRQIQARAAGKDPSTLKTTTEREDAWRTGDARIREARLANEIKTK
jgi:hypothetical protein